ncbi:MAG: hypothetical protein ABI835_12750 [Chloroflexota bacterium]
MTKVSSYAEETMTENRTDAIAALLSRTGAAHGVYEEEALNGVYDQNWARWYAEYAAAQGIGDLVGRAISVEELTAFLVRANEAHKQSGTDEAWATYYARALAEAQP